MLVETFASGVCNSLKTNYALLSAMPFPPQSPSNGCCYLTEIIGLKGFSKVMSLHMSPIYRVKGSCEGHAPICPLFWCYTSLCGPFLCFSQDIKDRVIYGSFEIIYGLISCFRFTVLALFLMFGFVVGKYTPLRFFWSIVTHLPFYIMECTYKKKS